MGWFVDKLKSGRVSMAIAELKWELDAASEFRCAEILVAAQRIRVQILEEAGIPRQAIAAASAFPREDVMTVVSQLEDIIIEGERMFAKAKKHAKSIGIDTTYMASEAKLQRHAHQVWIATLGASAKQVADLRQIWARLVNSRPQVPRVIDQIEAYDEALAGMTEPSQFSKDQILEMCLFVPQLN